jgi:DNA-binding response OmpR family regulator
MKFRAILCENNEYIRKILVFILQERGHEVFTYKDAKDLFLSSCAKCKGNHKEICADIIIPEVSISKDNGLGVLEELKNNGCRVKNIALVSDNWAEIDISKAKELGCSIFYKPVAPEELFEWIETCENYRKQKNSQKV